MSQEKYYWIKWHSNRRTMSKFKFLKKTLNQVWAKILESTKLKPLFMIFFVCPIDTEDLNFTYDYELGSPRIA